MISESAEHPKLCGWFTSLVSKSSNLPALNAALEAVRPVEARVIPMAQGQKQSRILAWTFLPKKQRV
jgi:23S rRNA (adenine1618-N6)-methyltransferase